MLAFRRVRLDDRKRIAPLLYEAPGRGCEYTFGNLYIWHNVYDTEIAFSEDGNCVVRFDKEVDAYLFPVGPGDIRATVAKMINDSEGRGVPFRIIAASKEDTARLDAWFPGQFSYHENRDFAEYVYNSEDLISLAGKKYHGKRNHISRFRADYPDYVFEEITPGNIETVRAMNDGWYRMSFKEGYDEPGLESEQTAARNAFDAFFDLDFKGGMVLAGGKIVAFAIGEAINAETFCVHIEKACYDVNGAYTVINRDFAKHFCANYRYINREDDVGLEGLRRAKLSYHPAFLTEKYVVTKHD